MDREAGSFLASDQYRLQLRGITREESPFQIGAIVLLSALSSELGFMLLAFGPVCGSVLLLHQ